MLRVPYADASLTQHTGRAHHTLCLLGSPSDHAASGVARKQCSKLPAKTLTANLVAPVVLQKDANLKGCFVYTSSASAVLPSPFAVSYASTKAFLSMFAISLAPEVKWMGIDVLAVHPSPVASR